jgi:carboxymethylenebutenolidase
MAGDLIRIADSNGGFLEGIFAVASAGHGPGLVIFLDSGAEDAGHAMADLYAAEGYAALAVEASSEAGAAAAIALLRGRSECTGRLGAVGFGQGSVAALDLLTGGRVDCAVCYSPPTEVVQRLAARLSRPLVLHFAGADPAASPDALARLSAVFAEAARLTSASGGEGADRPPEIYAYPSAKCGFENLGGAAFDRSAAGVAHSRSLALLRRVIGPHYDLEALWEAHTRHEFATRDVAATMATMVAEPYVNHVPTMTGGVGRSELTRFYAHHFIPKCPADIALVPVSRTVGADRIVDEMVVSFTHDIEIDWMLPGIPPTGRRVEVPLVAIVGFRGDKLYHEHIYWDQASVLVQIGALDPKGLPVAGAETAKKLLDESLPSNTLMKSWAETAPPGE